MIAQADLQAGFMASAFPGHPLTMRGTGRCRYLSDHPSMFRKQLGDLLLKERRHGSEDEDEYAQGAEDEYAEGAEDAEHEYEEEAEDEGHHGTLSRGGSAWVYGQRIVDLAGAAFSEGHADDGHDEVEAHGHQADAASIGRGRGVAQSLVELSG
jgi:hypothetical protein